MKKLSTLLITSTFLLFTAVSCNDNEPEPLPGDTTIAVTGVALNQTTGSIVVGDSLVLTATISPENATNQNVTWSSSNTTVATVLNGVITAVAEGTATITVTTQDGNRTATSAITVVTAPIPVESVSLNETEVTLEIGDEFTLIATILPENATNQNVTWESSDITVLTVLNGVATAIAEGTAIITVTTQDGNHTARCTITVSPTNIPVTGVTLPATSAVNVGETITLTATVLPANATNRTVTWSSNNTAVATVNSNGVVTGVSEGTAIITVATEDGGHTAASTITVLLPLPMTGCNFAVPLFGGGATGVPAGQLGQVTWGNNSNTDINATTGTGAVTVVSRAGNVPAAVTTNPQAANNTQTWSGAVFAQGCAKGTASSNDAFNGGSTGNFNADCRQSLHSVTARGSARNGDFFSWCAVMRYAHELCPHPWRVPTTEDFRVLHWILTGNTPPPAGGSVSIVANTYMGTAGTAAAPQIGGTWQGARFTGSAGILTLAQSRYWSSSEVSATNARRLHVTANLVWPEFSYTKADGFAVRCVR